jgi:hypothetical protein
MILDKKFLGILDQETGVLVVFSKEVRYTTYDDVNETVTAMNKASLSVLMIVGGGVVPVKSVLGFGMVISVSVADPGCLSRI